MVLLTWEPWAWGSGTSQPAYSLDRITAGDFDSYLRQWGQALADWGHPVMLRFGHEMNGNWYPWSEQLNGNGPGDYVAAWRHIHDVVASTGTSNVTWLAELRSLAPASRSSSARRPPQSRAGQRPNARRPWWAIWPRRGMSPP